jgi:hypothetical protein
MKKSALASPRPHAPVPVDEQRLGDDTIPSTPYTPRAAFEPLSVGGVASSTIRRRAVGDSAGEHRYMRRGRFSAWPHVVLAFLAQTVLVGAACAAPAWLGASRVLGAEAALWVAFAVFAATGPAAAYLTFRDRWRCIEAFASRFCVGVLNLSLLYVPLVALGYANVRAVQRLSGR